MNDDTDLGDDDIDAKLAGLLHQLERHAKDAALKSSWSGGEASAFDVSAGLVRKTFVEDPRLRSDIEPRRGHSRSRAAGLLEGAGPRHQRPAARPSSVRQPIQSILSDVYDILRLAGGTWSSVEDIQRGLAARSITAKAPTIRRTLLIGVKAGNIERDGEHYRVRPLR